MHRTLLFVGCCFLLTVLLAGCQLSGLVPVQTPGEAAASGTPPAGEPAYKVDVVAGNLGVPWALAFSRSLPGVGEGEFLLFNECPGRVCLIAGGRLQSEPVATLPVAAVAE